MGTFPGQQLKQHDTQTVDIRPGVALPLLILLRRRVAAGSERHRVRRKLRSEFPGRPQINQHNGSVRLKHYVGRLHIPVYDRRRLSVQISQYLTELSGPVQYPFHRLGSLLPKHCFQRLSFHIIHDNQQALSLFNHIHDAGQMGIFQTLH